MRSFEDRWEGGINVYLEWMEPRLRQMHRVLRPTGSLYLHCDMAAGHYLKVLTDSIFGAANFRNEIVWQRALAKGDARKKHASNHDMILAYGRSSDAYFEPARHAPDDVYVARFRLNDHDDRGPYRLAPLDSPNPRPNLTYEYKGFDPPAKGWRVSRQVMEELDADGRLAFPARPDGRIARKHYLYEQHWPTVGDVWTDISPLQAASAERLGYPTQKPEALLERIITSASRPDDVVLDPFCGCGTTIAVAEKLGREWLGMDISAQAVEIIKLRLNKLGASPKTPGLPTSVADLRAMLPFGFQHWIVQRVMGTPSPRDVADMGVDGYSFFELLPIQVKQSESVGRGVIDEFETAVARTGKHMGYVVAFSFTRGAYEEAARAKRENRPEIVLVKVEDVVRIGDLIDSADRIGVAPDLSRVTPDLIGLFSALQQPVSERPFQPALSREARPSAEELVRSARLARAALTAAH